MRLSTLPAAVAAALLASPAAAMPFAFDDGAETAQGWTIRISDGAGTVYASGDPAGWLDATNHPNPPRTDPTGDGAGAASVAQLSALDPDTDELVFSFISPDLSGMSDWQNLASLSGQVAPSFSGASDAYAAEIFVGIEDTTGGGSVDRTVGNIAESLTLDAWNEIDFAGFDDYLAALGVDSYVTEGVTFNIRQTPDAFDGLADDERVFALDEVTPTQAAQGGGPDGAIPLPAALPLLGAGLVALGAAARRRAG